jgi:hypothetical protein
MMTDEQKLELMFDLTSHPGWKLLIEDLVGRDEALKESLTSQYINEYNLGLVQGTLKVYRELINLRQVLDKVLADYKEDRENVEADYV